LERYQGTPRFYKTMMYALMTVAAIGHGLMLDPISRNALQGINTLGGSMWFSQGCTIGCTICNDTGSPVPTGFPESKAPYTPNTNGKVGDMCPNDHSKSKTPTIMDPSMTTMNGQEKLDGSNWTAWHPWRAPGSTPGLDPCGMAGGARTNMSMRAGGFGPQTGYPQGFKGTDLPPVPKEQRRIWKAGGIADVSWVSVANHAGGYTYSLCPADAELTEECFEKTQLVFVDSTTKLQYMFMTGNGTFGKNHTEVTIPAHRVSGAAVHPPGSQWSKNPVPPGLWANGQEQQGNAGPPQFEPPAGCDESCWGYQPCNVGFTHPSYEGWNHTGQLPSCSRTSPTDPLHNGEGCCHTTAYMAVKDQVKVPKVQPGEYVVRWRWDCEQSPQIWSGCGDVTIE